MEATDSAPACMVGGIGHEPLERCLRRGARLRLFQSVVTDIERAAMHFKTDLIDEGTLLGVLRDRVAALEQLAQGELPPEASGCSC